jgi:hypothetical protein
MGRWGDGEGERRNEMIQTIFHLLKGFDGKEMYWESGLLIEV